MRHDASFECIATLQVALNTLLMVASRASCTSEFTSLMPRLRKAFTCKPSYEPDIVTASTNQSELTVASAQ